MGEAKLRRDKPLISILVPERGRPAMLNRLVMSLFDTAKGDPRFEVLVSIDEDDPAWDATEPGMWSALSQARIFVDPRPNTLGEKLNILAARATGDIVAFIANDYVMLTDGWPQIIRDAVEKLPNGIGVPFLKDSLHPDHASFPVLSRKMYEASRMFAPPWFPYWYVDTWWDEVGLMLGIRPEIAVEVEAPEGRGKSQGLKDVTFWATFFDRLRPYRARDARLLAQLAWGKDSDRMRETLEMIEARTAFCAARNGHLMTPEFAAIWEGRRDDTPTPGYQEVKTYAATMMDNMEREQPKRTKVMLIVPSGRTWEATTANSLVALAAYSAQAGIEMGFLNLQTSQISLARNNSVKIALDAGVDYILWIDSDMEVPPDTLVRLLSHGKSICGASYNQKTPKPGTTDQYRTLGRPLHAYGGELTDGLHEWALLPGGVMLVATEVYRKLHWPWYSESYRWAPDLGGLAAFKVQMREYFDSVPSEAVLSSIDQTPFGQWLEAHYTVGEAGCNSEDYAFCNKARQAGYQIWCDLPLTGRIGHIGQKTVTCVLPDGMLKLAAD